VDTRRTSLGNNRIMIAEPRQHLPAPDQGEPYLLTPGPLTTSITVKRAMLRDWGSWDGDFRAMTTDLRNKLLDIVPDNANLECVPMQGSGTFLVEAMLGSFVPPAGKVLVLKNGAYGQRIADTLTCLNRAQIVIDKGDYLPPRGDEVADHLAQNPDITHVVAVHCETSSGILNPLREISDATARAGRRLLIDDMSAFGALSLDGIRFDALVSSANKCLEGVPGFGFVIATRDALKAAKGQSHSLSLDVHAQWTHMEKTGQWRFTPPTHVVAALLQALCEFNVEGGQTGRLARYTDNRDVLVDGMATLGFETLLKSRWLSPIIVTFFNPAHPNFSFQRFYELMKSRGFIIYPGKLTVADSFRIGCIGQIDRDVMINVVEAVKSALGDMGVDNAAPPDATRAASAALRE